MSCDANAFVADMQPYQPGRPIEAVARELGLPPENIIKLASNENPLGMSPKAAAAAKLAMQDGARYPEGYALTQALAARYGVDPAQVVLGNGSNDVLDLIARVFLDAGSESVISQYAFVMYELAVRSTGATPVVAPAKDYGHDLGSMLAAITPKTRVLWIANPNNPTGTFIPYARLHDFMQRVPQNVVVVLDEAYYEYLAPQQRADSVAWLQEFSNLIVVRTFSKVHGMAGLRIGYGLMSAAFADLLNRVRQPFSANRLGLAAAVAALDDAPFVARSIEMNNAGRAKLLAGLQKLHLETIGTEGNFVTVRLPDAAATVQALLRQGVIVRPLGPYGMADFVRITIGTPAENQRLLAALAKTL